MTVYAKQVPPEWQENSVFWEDITETNINIFGNKQYRCHKTSLFEKLPEALEELYDIWANMQYGAYNNVIWADEINDILPPEGRGPYTREERAKTWPTLLKEYVSYFERARCEEDVFCDILELITGRAWDRCTLRGCCQGDWQNCIYPVDEWDGDSLERLEMDYFNTGTEWIIHDDKTPPESPEDINGYSLYCYSWNDDGLREEIAAVAECKPEEVKLYKFNGFKRIATYTEV
jgi:hypothetical protein